MSPRRNYPKNRRSKPEEREISPTVSSQSFEEHADGDYIVRKITGSTSTKPYRCPGCDQMIPLATPHTVAWRDGEEDSRRHWHNSCWSKKNNRKPNTERTRNAPRF